MSISIRNFVRISIWALSVIFLLLNIVAIFHAYKFTHFSNAPNIKATTSMKLDFCDKVKLALFGVDNPRPVCDKYPTKEYRTIRLQSNFVLECQIITSPNSKGTIALFHGYGGDKSDLIEKAEILYNLGYSSLLVDFMGSGGSEGNNTTIGFFEAEQVRTCYDFLTYCGEDNIYLFGSSMGAAAIMKAVQDYDIRPKGLILECPFGSMYQTVTARFRILKAPSFPMAELLVFWGGVINGFWAFGHNPTAYAEKISCPTLLMYGANDEKVSLSETDEIFKNLSGIKKLKIFEESGHDDYLKFNKLEWIYVVESFLSENDNSGSN